MQLIVESARRLFERHDPLASRAGEWPEELWKQVEEAGYPLSLLGEDEGGFGFTPAEALAPVAIAAAQAVPLPIGETMLVNWLLVRAGLEPVEGPGAAVAVGESGLRGVPFGRRLHSVIGLHDADGSTQFRLYRPAPNKWRHGENIAGEARDDLATADLGTPIVQASSPIDAVTLRALCAALRAHQMAGAMGRVLDVTLRYGAERMQFGRALSAFQAVQHQFAQMAGQVAAATTAADIAINYLQLAVEDPAKFVVLAGAAKLRAGDAATAVAASAHQIHGAIGFTHEYPLHPLTRRLWSWRDDNGNETEWAIVLASAVAALPKGGLWPFLTSLHETAN